MPFLARVIHQRFLSLGETPDGPGNATTKAHASVPTGVVAVLVLPPAATCFEFTSIRHEKSLRFGEKKEREHARCVQPRRILICDCHL